MNRYFISVVLLASLTSNASEDTRTWQQVYEQASEFRSRANPLWDHGLPTTEQLLQAETILLEGVEWIRQPAQRAQAERNEYVRYREFNILYDLVIVNAKQRDLSGVDNALAEMEKFELSADAAQFWQEVEDIQEIFALSPIKERLASWRAKTHLLNDSAFASTYQPSLSIEQKMSGLAQIWAALRLYYVNADLQPTVNLQEQFQRTVAPALAAETTQDYYRELVRFAASIGDGHTNIYYPKAIRSKVYSRPPLYTALIEDKVIVLEVRSSSVAELGIDVGDEVLTIDGVPAKQYGEQHIMPFVSSSTPQDKLVRTYSYGLLSGDSERPVTLELLTAKGQKKTVTVARSGYTDVQSREQFASKEVAPGIHYLNLSHFESEAGLKKFREMIPALQSARGLILDVRQNGGGSSDYGWDILAHLSARPLPKPASFVRVTESVRPGTLKWRQLGDENDTWPNQAPYLTLPVAVLIGPETFSAAEDFAVVFDMMKRGPLIGEATGGSTGQPVSFELPGGGSMRICAKRDRYPDGREFVAKGIQPTIPLARKLSDMRRQHDAVLASAINYIQQQKP